MKIEVYPRLTVRESNVAVVAEGILTCRPSENGQVYPSKRFAIKFRELSPKGALQPLRAVVVTDVERQREVMNHKGYIDDAFCEQLLLPAVAHLSFFMHIVRAYVFERVEGPIVFDTDDAPQPEWREHMRRLVVGELDS